jgi:hypothetical protein
MSLFRSSLRPPAILSDEAVERYLASLRADLELDPLFRRRLRGRVMNEYVAVREEHVRRPRASMGRLGRAVLYASVTLMLGVSTAMAASQGAIPGDPLYPVKRQIEELRLQALPADFHDELVAYALAERITELDRLAELGRWGAVTAHARAVEAEYGSLTQAIDVTSAPVKRHLIVLGEMLARLPERAQASVERVMGDIDEARRAGSSAARRRGHDNPRSTPQGGALPGPSHVPRATPGADETARAAADRGPKASPGVQPVSRPSDGGDVTGEHAGESSVPGRSDAPRPSRSPVPGGGRGTGGDAP